MQDLPLSFVAPAWHATVTCAPKSLGFTSRITGIVKIMGSIIALYGSANAESGMQDIDTVRWYR